VDIDASFSRALPILKHGEYLKEDDVPGAKNVLRAGRFHLRGCGYGEPARCHAVVACIAFLTCKQTHEFQLQDYAKFYRVA